MHLSCDDPFDEDVHMRILDRRDSEPEPVPVAMPVPVPMPVQVPVPEPVPVPVLESIDAMELSKSYYILHVIQSYILMYAIYI